MPGPIGTDELGQQPGDDLSSQGPDQQDIINDNDIAPFIFPWFDKSLLQVLLEQLTRILPADDSLPEQVKTLFQLSPISEGKYEMCCLYIEILTRLFRFISFYALTEMFAAVAFPISS